MEHSKIPLPFPKRGSVYLINLDPTFGTEIKKTRPAVIIQNDFGNEHGTLTIVAPITSNISNTSPVRVLVNATEGGLKNNSSVLLNQVRAVDKRRLIRPMGTLKPQTMRRIDHAIKISLGLIPL